MLARGVTIIRNAAIEPEIADLAKFLTAMGARIEGAGTPTLRIEGVEQLGGAAHRLIPDRIEAGTLLIAAAVSGGSATVRGVVPEHLDAVLQKLREAGAEINVGEDWVSIGKPQRGQVNVFGQESIGKTSPLAEKCTSPHLNPQRGQVHYSAQNVAQPPSAVNECPRQPGAAVPQGSIEHRLRAVDIVAQPYPGFPTDLQAQWTALAAVSEGRCRVEDRVFPGRFMHVAELNRLGADITCAGGAATIVGGRPLSGAEVTAHDLRAGAALLMAGLATEGRTTIAGIHHIDRGYQRLDDKLRQLGARIERVERQTLNNSIPKPVAASFSGPSRLASGQPSRMASSK